MRFLLALSVLAVVRAQQLPAPGFAGNIKFKCSTAMNCTSEQFCDASGVISQTPVDLSEEARLRSVPKLPCRMPSGGDGVCCRDPDYKDDWPANYVDPGLRPKPPGSQSKDNAATRPRADINEDEKSEPDRKYLPPKTYLPPKLEALASVKDLTRLPLISLGSAPKVAIIQPPSNAIQGSEQKRTIEKNAEKMIDVLKTVLKYAEPAGQKPKERHIIIETVKPKTPKFLPQVAVPFVPLVHKSSPRTERIKSTLLTGCPRRNRTALPDKNTKYDHTDFDSGAGEFPWQAAVLDNNGKLLCGCYFTEEDTCVTSAACVNGVHPSHLQVAVGAYDASSLLSVKEPNAKPKPAQILAVESVESTDHVAIVFFKDSAQLNYYTLPICVDRQQGIPFENFDDCVVTGWGEDQKTYHWFDVQLLSNSECVKYSNMQPHQSCARAHNPLNKDICGLIENGGGLQCRYLGDRNSRKNEVYWLKGVLSSCTSEQVLVYDHLDIDWFEMSLMNQRQK